DEKNINTKLIAYVIMDPNVKQLRKENEILTEQDIKEYMAKKLQQYMIPNNIVFLEKLPLTPNGKVDRRSLPEPDRVRPDMDSVKYKPPSTPIQKQIAEIWKQLLNLEQVGIHDNFFELGGHSLLATQLVSRLRSKEINLDIPLRLIF